MRCWSTTASSNRSASKRSRGRWMSPAPRRCLRRYSPISAATCLEPVIPVRLGDTLPRQRIGAFVFGVAGMTAHPDPGDIVPSSGGVEPVPEIDVLDWLLVGGEPPAALPAVHPFGDAVAQILAVAVEAHPAGALQSFQSRDRRRHLHAIVGGVGIETAQLLF